MSAPSADSKPVGGAGVIIGVAAALMLCATLFAFLYMSRGGDIDGAALLEETFGVGGLGPEYGIVQARELPNGSRLVIFEDKGAPPEAGKAVDPPKAEERVDWRKVVIPPCTSRPRMVVFTLPKPGAKQSTVEAFFEKSEWKDVADLDSSGGKVVVNAKKIAWRGYDAAWVHERAYERPLTFRDSISANRSLAGQPCVMSAFWTRGEAGSEAALTELLARLGSTR
jgi:hypothetical protein